MRLSWTPGNTAREEPMRLSLTRFLLAFLLRRFGPPIRDFIERRLTLVTTGAAAAIVLGFVALKFL